MEEIYILKKVIMDFSKFKEQALQLKQKAIDVKNKAVDFSAEKISQSWLVLKNQSDLDALVWKSENKTITTKDGDEKIFVKRSILVAWDANKDFFKEFIISIPVLLTKSFSQSLAIKVLDIHNQNIDISRLVKCGVCMKHNKQCKTSFQTENF